MKTKRKILILIIAFLSAEVILLSFKCFNYPSLTNSVVNTIMRPPICKDCNVILISLDTLSANHLPCYGYERNTAPNLCKFGEDNIMFTNAFSNASWTLPSHVSIFTGLYPNQHKVNIQNVDSLSRSIPFLPEILQQNGYKTYFNMPLNSEFFPIDKVYNRGIDQLIDSDTPQGWVSSLKTLTENNKKGQKTFLFLHTYWVHEPYIPENKKRIIFAKNLNESPYLKIIEDAKGPDRCNLNFLYFLKKEITAYGKEYPIVIDTPLYIKLMQVSNKENMSEFCSLYGYSQDIVGYYAPYANSLINTNDAKMMSHMKDLYDSKIFELDEYLQNTLMYVLNSDLKKNTVIVITADHGEEFMEHGLWGHGRQLYDTMTKVPLMIYIPGQKNIKISQAAQSVDIVPTLLNVLKINNSYRFFGSDLFVKDIFNTPKYVFAEEGGSGVIRDNKWKLFYQIENNNPVGIRLFDFKKDPQEKNDVIFTNNTTLERLLKNIPK